MSHANRMTSSRTSIIVLSPKAYDVTHQSYDVIQNLQSILLPETYYIIKSLHHNTSAKPYDVILEPNDIIANPESYDIISMSNDVILPTSETQKHCRMVKCRMTCAFLLL